MVDKQPKALETIYPKSYKVDYNAPADTGPQKLLLISLVAAISLIINVLLYLKSPIADIIGLAIGMTVGFMSIAMNIIFATGNPLLKMRMMRILSPGKNYGIWTLVEPGKGSIHRVASFKTVAFKDGERIYPMPDEKYINRIGNGPWVVFNSRDTKPILMESERSDEEIRNPGKLYAFCELYTAKAEAGARRKNQLNVGNLMLCLYIIVILNIISVYYGYSINDFVVKNLPALVGQAAKSAGEAAGGLLPVGLGIK